jgi:hypothetical protein
MFESLQVLLETPNAAMTKFKLLSLVPMYTELAISSSERRQSFMG